MKTKGCPFCGDNPEVIPWHGGGPGKMMVSCDNNECPVQPQVTGETETLALKYWNTRDGEVSQ